MKQYINQSIPWHWHPALEIDYVVKDECKIFAHIFDTTFLSGLPGSLLEHKYVLPITQNDRLQIYPILPDSYQGIQMMEKIIKMVKLNEEEPSGYELLVRSELSLFWNMFFEETRHLQTSPKQKENPDIDRMKAMIQYIQTHYMEKITLEDIASSANIGARECTRCFRNS